MKKLIGSLRTRTIVASLAGGCIAGLLGLFPQPDVDVRWDIPALRPGTYTPQAGMEAGTELVLIFVGSSNCGWSNVAELPELFSKIRGDVLLAAKERSTGFATLGVARDLVVQNGLEHLEKFGPFDEVTAGRGWLNMGVLEYIYGDMPGVAATPQVIVVERTVERDGEWRIEDQRVLARRAGLDEIEEWAKEGAPLPPEIR